MTTFTRLLILALLCLPAVLFAAETDPFPEPFNTEKSISKALPGDQTAAGIRMPEGFQATCFASEPDVRQPIAMTTDARGRLWVAENYTYSERLENFTDKLRDRILIFEDSDNDGHYDKRTIFWDGARRLTSIEIGRGGVWALCLPELVFIPDRDGDDVPDSEPEALLDGFVYETGRHTVANGLRWGPDGWLYGRQGILAQSLVGKPGTPEEERIPTNVGIWRYNPERKVFEIVAVGTTNPWGMDWNAQGELFFINTVIGHLWHVIPGAHYRRMTGPDLDPQIYDIIEQHADHVHWATGEDWTDVRRGVSGATSKAGGGHAHTGLLIYQGGSWPSEWNGKLLTVNFHGKRLNVERLEREGTGFVGKHQEDNFAFPDPWFRGVDIIPAPDGGIFISDWSDSGECHDNDGIHRLSGRIYKLNYGPNKPREYGDLEKMESVDLALLQNSSNVWLERMSRRVLSDRAALGHDQTGATAQLRKMIAGKQPDPLQRLRASWTLHAMGANDWTDLAPLLEAKDEALRAWAIRLLEDGSHRNPDWQKNFLNHALREFPEMARSEPSGLVRLTLASLLQKLPPDLRLPLAAELLSRGEDADDHNQPLMLWVGILPLAETDNRSFENLIINARLETVQRYGARRLAEEIDEHPDRIDYLLTQAAEKCGTASCQAILDGLADGISGRRQVAKPRSWERVSAKFLSNANNAMRYRLQILGAVFGDGLAVDALREVALNTANSLPQRKAALEALVEARVPALREVCEALLPENELTVTAVSGLVLFEDSAIVKRIISLWPGIDSQARNNLMNLMISRRTWIPFILDAVEAGIIDSRRIGAYQARQIRAFGEPGLDRRVEEIQGKVLQWGMMDYDKEVFNKWRRQLSEEQLSRASLANGLEIFRAVCGVCHQLNGEGGTIGPDLTGSARDNLEYLLENILTPSATVADEYRQLTVTLKDGRIVGGTEKSRSAKVLQMQTVTGVVNVDLSEVVREEKSDLSVMPEGLLDAIGEEQARDLIAFLMQK